MVCDLTDYGDSRSAKIGGDKRVYSLYAKSDVTGSIISELVPVPSGIGAPLST